MILVPLSFNGTSLSSSDYDAWFPRAAAELQVASQPGYVKRAGAYPIYAGKDYTPKTLSLNVKALHDYTTLFESINTLFDTQDETPKQFICADSEDSNKQYYVYATPAQVMGGHDGNVATVILALDDPIWQSVTQNSQAWSITTSTSSTDVTVNGNADSYPIFEFTPTSSPSTDFIYAVFLQVLPTSANPWAARPVCITGSSDTTWDTAALVAAGKMQADGDDIRVYRDSVETNFWVSGVNTTDTKVWVTADMPEARNMLLTTAIGATDTVTELTIGFNDVRAFAPCPPTGRLIVDTSIGSTDTEEFVYTAKNHTDTGLSFTIQGRGGRNTTAVDHAVGSNVRFLPYNFRLGYGNASSTAAAVDNATQPIINLSTSSNGSFVYSTFYDTTGLRSGAWKPFIRSQSDPVFSRSTHYTSTSDEGDTDPATEMGIKAQTFQSGGLWRPDSVYLTWRGDFPDYIASFSASGEQNQSASSIPTFGMAWADAYGGLHYLWTLSAQASTDYSTWTTWTKATTDSAAIPVGLTKMAFIANGSILGASDLYAKAGVSAATVNVTNYPHVMIRSELATSVNLNCRVTNNTTGEYFTLLVPMEGNTTVYADCDPDFPTVTYNGIIANGAIKTSTTRASWLRLQPGSNTISFDNLQSVANDFTITVKWRDRMNYY